VTAIILPLLLALHLICVNVAAAGPLVCLWLEIREGRGDTLAGRAGRYLAGSAVWLLLAGIALGLLMGWLLWSEEYVGALRQVRSRAWYGVWEIGFSLALMLVHAAWWFFRPNSGRWERAARCAAPLLSGTNLMYHFPPLFVVISQLSASPPASREPLTSAQFMALMLSGEVLARSTHFWLAAAAMCGVMLIGYALRLRRRGAAEDDVRRVALWGGRLALAPTLAQLGVGLWVLLALPAQVQFALLGGDPIGAALLGLSLVAALALTHQLAAVSFGDVRRESLLRAMMAMVLVVLLMSATLERTRALERKSQATVALRRCGRGRFDLPLHVLDAGLRAAFHVARGEDHLRVAKRLLVAGQAEVVALLHDRVAIVHAAEAVAAGRLAGNPMPGAFAVFEVELGVAVSGDPHRACRNAPRAAERHEQRRAGLAVALFVGQGFQRPLQLADLVADRLVHVAVDRLDDRPRLFLPRGDFFGELQNRGMPAFDLRALAQKRREFARAPRRQDEDARVGGRRDGAARDLEREQRLRGVPGREPRNADHHLPSARRNIAIGDAHARREFLPDDLHLLLGPLGGDGGIHGDARRRAVARFDDHAHLPALHDGVDKAHAKVRRFGSEGRLAGIRRPRGLPPTGASPTCMGGQDGDYQHAVGNGKRARLHETAPQSKTGLSPIKRQRYLPL
jgi:hypothetical protein